jgi:hypothetical protein
MVSSLQIAVRQIYLTLLWGASLLVPAWRRSEWSHEWRTELWYVFRECFSETSASPSSIRKTTRFCMGAYRDAICLRELSWRTQKPLARIRGSAAACLLLLIGIFFAAWGIAHSSPRVAAGISRIQVYPWRVSDTGAAPCDCPFDLAVGGRSFRAIEQLFDGFSHYKVTEGTAWSKDMPRTKWTVAHARSGFFGALHLPVRLRENVKAVPDRLPQVVLGQDTWMRDFGGNPNIAGAKLHIGSVAAIIAGVAFRGSMGLPGGADVWLLGSDPQVGDGTSEFVVGHLSPVGYFDDGRWALSAGGILLGFLILPFVSRPSIGEYSIGSQKPSLARRSRFGAFLVAKIATLLAIAYFASVDRLPARTTIFAAPFPVFFVDRRYSGCRDKANLYTGSRMIEKTQSSVISMPP